MVKEANKTVGHLLWVALSQLMSRSHGEFLSKYLHLSQTNGCCISVALNKCSSNQACCSFGEVEAAPAAAGRHASPGSPQVYRSRCSWRRKPAALCTASLHLCAINNLIWDSQNSTGRCGKPQVRVWDFTFGAFVLFFSGCCGCHEDPKLQNSVRFFSAVRGQLKKEKAVSFCVGTTGMWCCPRQHAYSFSKMD